MPARNRLAREAIEDIGYSLLGTDVAGVVAADTCGQISMDRKAADAARRVFRAKFDRRSAGSDEMQQLASGGVLTDWSAIGDVHCRKS